MATFCIAPTMWVLPSSILAATLTDGDCCAAAEFCKLNVTEQAVPANVPPDAAVSTSSPELLLHVPAVPRRSNVDKIGKLGESAVCESVSPDIVTVDPGARS